MKTSLMIEDSLYIAARAEAMKTGKTLSEIISLWARYGRDQLASRSMEPRPTLHSVDLGSPAQIDLSSRAGWMEMLER